METGVNISNVDPRSSGSDNIFFSNVPFEYRLVKDPWGNLYLQGNYKWCNGSQCGSTWKTIPTVDL